MKGESKTVSKGTGCWNSAKNYEIVSQRQAIGATMMLTALFVIKAKKKALVIAIILCTRSDEVSEWSTKRKVTLHKPVTESTTRHPLFAMIRDYFDLSLP